MQEESFLKLLFFMLLAELPQLQYMRVAEQSEESHAEAEVTFGDLQGSALT